MGQPITVVEKASPLRSVVRFEANRSLTGMGHERYRSRAAATGPRPCDELARRLFDTGKVEALHVYSNVVTVDLVDGADSSGLRDVVENLFRFYREGQTAPTP